MNVATDFADRVELFFGEASDTLCHVYARLRGARSADGLRLTGSLTGPACLYGKSLPATFRFNDRGPGDSLLARAIVPEPCFWTPEMPHLYQVQLQLFQGDQELAHVQRPLGIRTLGTQDHKLIYDGKRYVLRAVSQADVPPTELAHWRNSDAAMLVRDPDDALCDQASRVGVLLVAELDRIDATNIHRLSRWAAVGMVVLPASDSTPSIQPAAVKPSPSGRGQGEGSRSSVDDPSSTGKSLLATDAFPHPNPLPAGEGETATDFLAGFAHNVLLAQRIGLGGPITPAAWAQVLVCDVAHSTTLDPRIGDTNLPIVAFRASGPLESIGAARAECDRLQRDLAGRGDFSGYIV